MKFRDLNANEIDARVGQVGEGYCTLLLYKDARVDMDILDETVGEDNWQRKHYEVKGNLFCSVGINVKNGWVWKDDCGTESNTEKEKGESSDSFKRACVNWGIGRELYTAPLIKVNCKTKDKKVQDLTSFSVANIVIENKTITGLQIKAYDKENRTTDIVFSWGKCKSNENKAKIGATSHETIKDEQQGELTYKKALELKFKDKYGNDVALKSLDVIELGRLLKTTNPEFERLREGAKLILEFKSQSEGQEQDA